MVNVKTAEGLGLSTALSMFGFSWDAKNVFLSVCYSHNVYMPIGKYREQSILEPLL